MNFRTQVANEKLSHEIYLINHFNQLGEIPLSEDQRDYLRENLKASNFIFFPQKPANIFVAFADDNAKEPYQKLEKLRLLANKLVSSLSAQKADKVLLSSSLKDAEQAAFAEGLALGAYRFTKYFVRKKEKQSLQEIVFRQLNADTLKDLQAVVESTYVARNLVNEPLSYLTAKMLAKEIEKLGNETGFKVEVFNKKKIEALKMGGLLAVNRGSQDPPTFSILEYKSAQAKNSAPIVLVGKGVVYDTGGLSLKPTPGSMDSMKSDMGGAAAVIGAINAAAKAELPIHVIGLIPATDNRPGEKAYVPGDVVKMYDGSTVEVLNTDAEGRMLLADALAYAKNYKPQVVVDLATLTGAAAVAIGKYGVVAMGTADNKDFAKLDAAGKECYERVARFPFWDEYDELLKSTIADQKNIGGREAGAITAGKFLEHFTDYPWIHIDIAGPAFLDSADHYRSQGGTGVGVRLIYQFLKSL
jgi:leucyl aminopeptidase